MTAVEHYLRDEPLAESNVDFGGHRDRNVKEEDEDNVGRQQDDDEQEVEVEDDVGRNIKDCTGGTRLSCNAF